MCPSAVTVHSFFDYSPLLTLSLDANHVVFVERPAGRKSAKAGQAKTTWATPSRVPFLATSGSTTTLAIVSCSSAPTETIG